VTELKIRDVSLDLLRAINGDRQHKKLNFLGQIAIYWGFEGGGKYFSNLKPLEEKKSTNYNLQLYLTACG
jgi:hypothetical protein